MQDTKKIRIIGVPSDLGASRRGVDMGPSALRIANIGPRLRALGYEVEDMGNVPVAVRESISRKLDERIKYLPEIVDTACALKDSVY